MCCKNIHQHLRLHCEQALHIKQRSNLSQAGDDAWNKDHDESWIVAVSDPYEEKEVVNVKAEIKADVQVKANVKEVKVEQNVGIAKVWQEVKRRNNVEEHEEHEAKPDLEMPSSSNAKQKMQDVVTLRQALTLPEHWVVPEEEIKNDPEPWKVPEEEINNDPAMWQECGWLPSGEDAGVSARSFRLERYHLRKVAHKDERTTPWNWKDAPWHS